MNENLTVKDADPIPFVATAPDEICRINADGTTTYHWGRIEAAAQRWTPGCVDIAVCLAKLLLPLRRREWQSLTEDDVRSLYGKDLNYRDGDYERYARAIEQALKEKNHG
jgi:hypothetical protein